MLQLDDDDAITFPFWQVETIGDAYMVVGGIPEANTIHAQLVANFSLDMVKAANEVNSPATGKPLQVNYGDPFQFTNRSYFLTW